MARREQWIELTKKADFTAWGKALHITPLTARLLRNRDITTLEEAGQFLYGTMDDLADPHLMKDLDKGADLLEKAIAERQGIAIVSDFDDDGIFAGQILFEGLKNLGGNPVIYTPERLTEGYGLNVRIIDEAKRDGMGVILTCDNGIAAIEETDYAKSLGFTVIVTDHHEVQNRLPAADAVIDPKQADCAYPFKGLCGAGVAFRLIQVLYERAGIPKKKEEELYEYAAIATVADVMELKGENRILVKAGLEKLRITEKIGLKALIDVCGLVQEKISAYHIGFVIGPCFNAVGRLTHARLAFDLLQTRDQVTAIELASEIHALNEERKQKTEEGFDLAVSKLEHSARLKDPVMLVYLPGVHESVVGIIAGRLKERYSRPVFVFTDSGEWLKGSGRSIPAYHMLKGLLSVSDLLGKFGGHAMAAGLSIRPENLEKLREALNVSCGLSEKDLVPVVNIDARMPLSYVSEQLIREFSVLEPFGTGNPRPVFARAHFRIHQMRVIGKNRNTLRMVVSDESGTRMEAVLFNEAEEFISLMKETYGAYETDKALRGAENCLDAAFTYYPEINEYRDSRTLQITVRSYQVLKAQGNT
ncbi:MAG: single-stranded-DNA-specific exonuclease RecJ [Lachnospiraceae bacterium]|nr:single-stranded-DNA-specific exonuclease RecJ [Lachnospiraceae bacterium]